MKNSKLKMRSISTVFTVIFLAVVVLVNVVVNALTARYPSMDVDMTAQSLNSLSDTAIYVAESVVEPTTISVVAAEDDARNNLIYTSYGANYGQLTNVLDRIVETNPNITVEYVDPDLNPQFMAAYPDETITLGTVVVETETRHKVLQYYDMFLTQQDQTTGEVIQYNMVDGAVANALHLVNLDSVPKISIAIGHSELLNDSVRASFESLMKNYSFEIETFNILTQEIPEDTSILMMPTPSTDYTTGEIDKIRAFLDTSTESEPKSLLVTAHPTQGEMPVLDAFLEEWGVTVSEGVVLESDDGKMIINDPSWLYSSPNTDIFTSAYNYLIFPYSSPIELTFDTNGDITTTPLVSSSDSAYVTLSDSVEESPQTSLYTLASLSQRSTVGDSGEIVNSNVVVWGSSEFFLSDFMATTTFANSTLIVEILKNVSNTTDETLSIGTAPVQTNVIDIVATTNVVNILGIGVFTIGLPVALLILGLVVFIRRRHL